MRHRCLPSPLKNKVCVIRHSTFGRLGITHGLLETVNGILIYLFFTFSARLDELRCHCNLPVCVTTGYMCKSAMGTCFSEIVDRTDLSKSRHGCLELLTRYISTPYIQEKKTFQSKRGNCILAITKSATTARRTLAITPVIATSIPNDLWFSAARTICAITAPSRSSYGSIRPSNPTATTPQLVSYLETKEQQTTAVERY